MWTDVLDPLIGAQYGVNREAAFDEYIARNTYLKREQTPADIGETVVYLCRANILLARRSTSRAAAKCIRKFQGEENSP